MNVLIEVSTGKILTVGASDTYGGPWGQMLASGAAKISVVPDNESPSDIVVIDGVATIDAAKKAERLALAQQQENLLQKLKAIKKADLTDLDKCADAIIDLAKVVRRSIKGD
jgi:hypothetical protein